MDKELPPALVPISVWLSGRSYRILIAPEDEAKVRRSVKTADEQIAELRLHYAGKDDQDFIAMCLITYAAAEAGKIPDQYSAGIVNDMIAAIDKVMRNAPADLMPEIAEKEGL